VNPARSSPRVIPVVEPPGDHHRRVSNAAARPCPLGSASSHERIDPEAMIKLPKAERSKKMAELEKKRESYQKLLAEKGRIYTQLYAEFMKRYAEDCELKDLMAEFGGRPDYPPTKRSFREGCPLIVWIFSDKNAFNEYHEKVKGESIYKGIAGSFDHDRRDYHALEKRVIAVTLRDANGREFKAIRNLQVINPAADRFPSKIPFFTACSARSTAAIAPVHSATVVRNKPSATPPNSSVASRT
jgi:hypothetical protein